MGSQERYRGPNTDDVTERAAALARAVCRGFRAHDRGDRQAAIDAFRTVDSAQFPRLSETEAREAATAYVNALFEKDNVELGHLASGAFDTGRLADADWSSVSTQFRVRASLVGMDPEYAADSTLGWKRHKVGGDYWTPLQRAQMYELRAALEDPSYPQKPKDGRSGFGPEPMRYVTAVELHDMHTEEHWRQAERVMTPYFERILRSHADE
jgi:hypothetical protein